MGSRETSAEIDVRAIGEEDIRDVARLHHSTFGGEAKPGGSIAKLGRGFLAHAFYGVNLDNPVFFCDVAVSGGRVVGFSVYSTDRGSVFQHGLRRHPLRLFGATFRALLRSPGRLGVILRNLRYLRDREPSFLEGIAGWWIVAAVEPAFRSKGVAGLMFDEMERVLRREGTTSWYGVIHPDNDAIRAFTAGRGAREVGRAPAQGVEMVYVAGELGSPSSETGREGSRLEVRRPT